MKSLLEQQICFLRTFPTNKWDVGKQREMYELAYQESLARLETFENGLRETEAKFVARGVSTAEIENWRSGQTNQHIQLLEQAIQARRHFEWSQKTLREVLDEKIRLLTEELKVGFSLGTA